jgi:hypothetical protein
MNIIYIRRCFIGTPRNAIIAETQATMGVNY